MAKLGLSLKLKPVKKVIRRDTKVSNKLLIGKCFTDADGSLKMRVAVENDTDLILPLTDDSFDLHREVVFDKNPDKDGNIKMYIRSEREYKYGPGLDTQYSPIADRATFDGYLVRTADGVLKFKLNKFLYLGYGESELP